MRRNDEIYFSMELLHQQRARLAAQSEAQRRWLESDEPAVDPDGATRPLVCPKCGHRLLDCVCIPLHELPEEVSLSKEPK